MNFVEQANFSRNQENERAVKLFSRNRDLSYYYDNLCLYCANNNIDLSGVSDDDFMALAEVMESYGVNDDPDHFFFWID